MSHFLKFLLDFIFPPSIEERTLTALSAEEFFLRSPKAPFSPVPFIFSCFAYKDPLVRELVWQIKYKKNQHAIELAGYSLYKKLNAMSLQSPITLVPIPISKKRRRERGYNQCELVIDAMLKLDRESNLAEKLSKDFSILARPKHRDRQTDKNRAERMKNAEHIFTVMKPPSPPMLLILIDDVTTTGSTLLEARNTLLCAGYEDVRCVTIAH